MKNGVRLIAWLVVLFTTIALWTAAVVFGFIGSTIFIGHVSMLALVLTAGAAVEATLPDFDPKDKE